MFPLFPFKPLEGGWVGKKTSATGNRIAGAGATLPLAGGFGGVPL